VPVPKKFSLVHFQYQGCSKAFKETWYTCAFFMQVGMAIKAKKLPVKPPQNFGFET